MSYVLYDKTDHIVTITLNRPERMNAMGQELFRQLVEADKKFAADDDAWVAIYTGAGDRAFSAGRDLKEASEREATGKTSSVGIRNVEGLSKDSGKPTIAAINGAAFGGGMEKALACDIRICSDNATFGLAEVKVGLCPPTGSFRLPRLIGLSNAMWLLLSGEPVDAQEAHRIGLVTRVVPQADLLPTAVKMAETLCQNAPLAVRATRNLTTMGLELPMDYAYRMGTELMASVWESEDAVEGARAFVEKRKPNWRMK